MPLPINAMAPDFTATTTHGTLRFHPWMGDHWCMLFSHPRDFTPVSTTEIGAAAALKPEFDKRRVKMIGLSNDTVAEHRRWLEDISIVTGQVVNYPLIEDPDLWIAKLYDMLPGAFDGDSYVPSAMDCPTARSVYVIGPDKRIKLTLSYPMATGRDFNEILRVIDSLQLTEDNQVATPADWRPGDDLVISSSVRDNEAKRRFPRGWKAPVPYMRIVPHARDNAA